MPTLQLLYLLFMYLCIYSCSSTSLGGFQTHHTCASTAYPLCHRSPTRPASCGAGWFAREDCSSREPTGCSNTGQESTWTACQGSDYTAAGTAAARDSDTDPTEVSNCTADTSWSDSCTWHTANTCNRSARRSEAFSTSESCLTTTGEYRKKKRSVYIVCYAFKGIYLQEMCYHFTCK